jgi:hypothetical protein
MMKEIQKHVNWEWSHDTNVNPNMQKENIRQNDKGDTKASNLAIQEQWWKHHKEKRYKIQNKNQWESFWLFT